MALRKKSSSSRFSSLGVLVEGFLDVFQEPGADDAAAPPQQSDLPVVELPPEFAGRRVELHEALRVAGNLRDVEGTPHVFDERLFDLRETSLAAR